MAKKSHVKVRLVPEAKPDSAFYYYVKKPSGGEKAKIKLKPVIKPRLKKVIYNWKLKNSLYTHCNTHASTYTKCC